MKWIIRETELWLSLCNCCFVLIFVPFLSLAINYLVNWTNNYLITFWLWSSSSSSLYYILFLIVRDAESTSSHSDYEIVFLSNTFFYSAVSHNSLKNMPCYLSTEVREGEKKKKWISYKLKLKRWWRSNHIETKGMVDFYSFLSTGMSSKEERKE